MENYENIYNSICRLCLRYSNSKKMVSLIDKDGLTAYAKAVTTFAHINFTKDDCFPNNMCTKCLYLLKESIRFKLTTESSNICLKKLMNLVGSDIENLKEKVIEFTMLKFYFPSESYNTTKEYFEDNKSLIRDRVEQEILEKDEQVKENEFRSSDSVDDDFHEHPLLDSEKGEEISRNDDKILDKIESLIGSNIVVSQVPMMKQKVFKKKKKIPQTKRHNEQYKQHSTKKKNFVCNVCNKVLANQSTYDHHMQRHMGCRFICEQCGKGFPILNELQMHQVTKHGTGPYLQCTHCPFKAPRRFDLIEHERIHTGERPYTCDQCGLTFRRRGIWRKHLIYHTDKKIQCPQCPRKFFLRSEMLAHANNIHDRVYVYSCSKCDATYTKTATVRRHMLERHGIPKEMQGKIIRVNKGTSYREQ